jgi:pimeloyl-ACP methyl ester carboxylesterase
VHQGRAKANGLEFAFLEEGPGDGPLALCLHGFPDSAHTFRHLLPALAGAGYHAVAPWMRGYAPTDVPADGVYHQGALGADACALHDALGGDGRAVLVGHDWGALAAYCAAPFEPERWRRVVTLAIPPPATVAQAFFDYDQFKRSFYVFLFQTPLAEAVLAMEDLAFVERLWGDWSPGYDAAADLPEVHRALAGAENRSAAVGYYRAMFNSADAGADAEPAYQAAQAAVGTPPQPTLYLHGERDGAFAAPGEQEVAAVLSAGSVQGRVADAGHFLHLEHPDEVNSRIVEFVTA